MTHGKRILAGSLFLLFVACGLCGAATITVRSDNWPPFNGEPGSAKQGYMIDVLQEIFTAAGHKIDYKLMSWDDSLAAVRQGKFNAVVGASVDDAPDFVFPAESFGRNGNSFFVKQGNPWKFAGIDSLAKVRLGVIDSYSYETEIDKYVKEHKGSDRIVSISGEDALPLLIRMLDLGQIDAIVEDTNVMLYALINSNIAPGHIAIAGTTSEVVDLQVAFSPKLKHSREYAKIFDEGIVKLRKSGRLKAILSRYGLKDWK